MTRCVAILSLLVMGTAGLAACTNAGSQASRQPAVTPPPPAAAANSTGARPPLCRDVGGYEAYLRRTGKACDLGADAFKDPSYSEPL